jgi:threonine dehydratase
VIGVEPELAADAQASLRAGKIAQFPAEEVSRTIADGLRTQSLGELNFLHVRAFVDDIITVSEDEIRNAMRTMVHTARLTPEPSGAVTTAAVLFHQEQLLPYRKLVAVMSGGNVEPEVLSSILSETTSGA